jgi:death-on-curing protein
VKEPEFLLRDVVEYLHDRAIREHGGDFGMRDEGMLESALARPQQKWAYGDPRPSLPALAAAYAFGIGRNHAFVDGNKRAAWASCVLFLAVNGVSVRPPGSESVAKMIDLAHGALSEDEFANWLQGYFPT